MTDVAEVWCTRFFQDEVNEGWLVILTELIEREVPEIVIDGRILVSVVLAKPIAPLIS